MIIIEGPDGMGKTTLAKKLSEDLQGIHLYRIGGTPGSILDTRAFCARCVSRAGTWCIQDRVTQISEAVYSEIFERETLSSGEFARWQRELLFSTPRPVVIYARVEDLSKVTPVVEAYETQEYVDEVVLKLSSIRDKYDQLFRRMARVKPKHTRIIEYDYTKQPYADLVERISECVSRT